MHTDASTSSIGKTYETCTCISMYVSGNENENVKDKHQFEWWKKHEE